MLVIVTGKIQEYDGWRGENRAYGLPPPTQKEKKKAFYK